MPFYWVFYQITLDNDSLIKQYIIVVRADLERRIRSILIKLLDGR